MGKELTKHKAHHNITPTATHITTDVNQPLASSQARKNNNKSAWKSQNFYREIFIILGPANFQDDFLRSKRLVISGPVLENAENKATLSWKVTWKVFGRWRNRGDILDNTDKSVEPFIVLPRAL